MASQLGDHTRSELARTSTDSPDIPHELPRFLLVLAIAEVLKIAT